MGDTVKRDNRGRFLKGTKPGTGRPKLGYVLADLLRDELKQPNPTNAKETKFDAILKSIIAKAMSGDIQAVQLVLNRVFGKEVDIIKIDKSDEIDLSTLTDEELAVYKTLLEKTHGEQD